MNVIDVKNLMKRFRLPGGTARGQDSITVLKNLTFRVEPGSWTSLTGSSGSGKSTLLGLLAGLDDPSEGSIVIAGEDLTRMNEDERANFRSRNMGFIFQSFRLLPTLTALENVRVPLEILDDKNAEANARSLLERVGLSHRLNNLPGQLSGGEQQRVAIARAFASRPKLLLADEPTGNLDSKNGELVLELMKELQRENGSTLVVVTHDPQVAAHGQHQLRLRDGELIS